MMPLSKMSGYTRKGSIYDCAMSAPEYHPATFLSTMRAFAAPNTAITLDSAVSVE
ncbi:hypothetical protein ALP89_200107 [Pseudomonas syringae pv. persicae]|nr:hypothetical protein ALP89_200107 [Pseudomonas syringae pv. persicae]